MNKYSASSIKNDADRKGASISYVKPEVPGYNHPEDDWVVVVQFPWNRQEVFRSVSSYQRYMGY